jgi:hypothetical protein
MENTLYIPISVCDRFDGKRNDVHIILMGTSENMPACDSGAASDTVGLYIPSQGGMPSALIERDHRMVGVNATRHRI